MKSVFITGGAGLLATNFAVQKKDDWQITLLTHHRKVEIAGTNSVACNLDDVDELTRLLEASRADMVIHTAGLTNVELCESDPQLSLHANAQLAKNVAIATNKTFVSLVHISTDHLYRGDKEKYTEDDPVDPVNNYGKHKYLGEQFVQEFHDSPLIVRTNFFGWGPQYRHSFSDLILNKISDNQNVHLFSDVNFTPIFIYDLVELISSLQELRFNGIFNVSSPNVVSKYEFGLLLADVFGFDKTLICDDKIANRSNLVTRPSNMGLSIDKLESALGVKVGSLRQMFMRLKMTEHSESSFQIKSL